jgi:hypothetical protein
MAELSLAADDDRRLWREQLIKERDANLARWNAMTREQKARYPDVDALERRKSHG